jgi:hypothetical protein
LKSIIHKTNQGDEEITDENCWDNVLQLNLESSSSLFFRTSTHAASRTVILTVMNLLNTKALYNLSTMNFMEKLYREYSSYKLILKILSS